jgi:hypothetical protein
MVCLTVFYGAPKLDPFDVAQIAGAAFLKITYLSQMSNEWATFRFTPGHLTNAISLIVVAIFFWVRMPLITLQALLYLFHGTVLLLQ